MACFMNISDQIVTVDDKDYEKFKDMRWHVGKNGYAVSTKYIRGSGRKNQKNQSIYLHRLIMDCPESMVVDHINGNKLDNRRENLRICTQRENMVNCGLLKNNTSGVKGVSWSKASNKWEAFIHFNNKKIYLGVFKDKEEAIKKRDKEFNNYFGYIERKNYV